MVVSHSSASGGGNAANVAVCLSRLQYDVEFVTRFYGDSNGVLLERDINKENVSIKFSDKWPASEEGRTAVSYIIVEEKSGSRTIFHVPMEPHVITLRPDIDGIFDSKDLRLVFLDGRFGDAAELLAVKARHRHLDVVLDCERIDRRPRLEALLELSTVVICSAQFLPTYLPNTQQLEAMLRILRNGDGKKCVIVTSGADGSITMVNEQVGGGGKMVNDIADIAGVERAAYQGYRVFVTPAHQDVNVVDTTGAGDAFQGGFCAALGWGKSIDEACNFATYIAAQSVSAPGARGGLPYLRTMSQECLETKAFARPVRPLPRN
eukprot:GEMP01050379.1.p1 GENE.GEMP01050379.1~~GEMP01050379.1.p1  ORF type:complete len:321 (+),score=79.88 GEMP01050379.1:150-1112(+)